MGFDLRSRAMDRYRIVRGVYVAVVILLSVSLSVVLVNAFWKLAFHHETSRGHFVLEFLTCLAPLALLWWRKFGPPKRLTVATD
jgi:hypothetical protein